MHPRELEPGTGSKSPDSHSFCPMLRVPPRDWIDGTPVVAATTGLERVFPSSAAVSEVCSPCVLFPFFPNVPDVLRQLQNQFSSLDLTYRKGAWELSHLGFRVAWSEPGGHPCRFDAECPRVLGPETFADCAS